MNLASAVRKADQLGFSRAIVDSSSIRAVLRAKDRPNPADNAASVVYLAKICKMVDEMFRKNKPYLRNCK